MHMVLSMLLLIILYVGYVACYRLFFHPLRDFPGPSIAAMSGFYQLYYRLIRKGEMVHQIEHLHEKYGPVVRVGPNVLHFRDSQAYHDIYSNPTFTKDPEFYRAFAHCVDSSVAYCDPRVAKIRRQIISPLFSRQAIVKLESAVQEKVNKLVSRLSSHREPVSLPLAFRCTSMDIITSYCFATCFDTLDSPNFMDPIAHGTINLLAFFWVLIYFSPVVAALFALPSRVATMLYPPLFATLHMRKSIEDRVDSLLSDDSMLFTTEHETIYNHLLAPQKKDRLGVDQISRKSLVDEAVLLINAGSDTVADSCTVGTFYALKYPDIYQKLKAELCQAWPEEGDRLSYTTLEKLPYLTAFIKETLRFSHGVATPLPRIVGPSDSVIAGVTVPAGTSVATGISFLHRNSDIFEDPAKFWPDRWLQDDTKDMAQNLVPFSKGPRICLGLNLAWCELYLIFGNIFRRLDLTLHVTSETTPHYYTFTDLFLPHWEKNYEALIGTL